MGLSDSGKPIENAVYRFYKRTIFSESSFFYELIGIIAIGFGPIRMRSL